MHRESITFLPSTITGREVPPEFFDRERTRGNVYWEWPVKITTASAWDKTLKDRDSNLNPWGQTGPRDRAQQPLLLR